MSFVQGTTATSGATSQSTLTATFGAGVTTGNTVWGIVSQNGFTPTLSVTVGGVSAAILDSITTGGVNSQTATFILGNISGSPTSVVASSTQSGTISLIAIEESGCLGVSNPTDVHTGQNSVVGSVTTDAITSGNVTTTIPNDIIVGGCFNSGGTGTPTAGTGFTLRNTVLVNTALPMVTEDTKVLASPGTVAGTFTPTQTQTYPAFVIAIKPPVNTPFFSTILM